MRLQNKVFILSSILYLVLGIGSVLLGWQSEDARWNIAASANIKTFEPYTYFLLKDIAPPAGAPIGYTPLLLILTYPFVILNLAKFYVLILFLADILNVYLIIDFVSKLNPKVKRYLPVIILLLFFSGYFLFTSGFVAHPESLVLLFSLASIKAFFWNKNSTLAGIFLGLAISSKQSAIFILIPLLLYQFRFSRNIKLIFNFIFVSFITSFLILFPFLAKNFDSTLYGIYGYTNYLSIRGPNVWWLLRSLDDKFFRLNMTQSLLPFVNIVTLILSVLIIGYLISFKIKRINLTQLFGLISINLLFFSIFGKWISFHYFLLNFVFILIWDSTRRKVFPYFWIIYSIVLFTANFITNPLWQLEILLINLSAIVYIIRKL